MSLYRSIMRDFDDDPFFRGPMETMRHMESMMESMMTPFGGLFGNMGIPQLEYQNNRGYDSNRMNGNALMPFGFGRSLFPSVDDMFSNFNRLSQDASCHSYSSSSVMTYMTDEHGRPQVYQATSSRSTAPGGVSETRRSVQDTRTGVQKMAIGHHMKDKAHIVEKSHNRYTGEDEECQEFVNIEEDDAEDFNREWQDQVQPYRQRQPQLALNNRSRWRDRSPGAPPVREPLAITAGPASSPEIVEPGSPQIEEIPTVRAQPVASKPKRKHGSKGNRTGHRSHSRPHHETSM